MATVSQRRDLDDPMVIRNFARQVETPEKLNLLDTVDIRRFAGHERQTVERLQGFFALAIAFARHANAHRRHGIHPRRGKNSAKSCWQEVRELAPKKFTDEELDAHFTRCRRAILKSTLRRKFWTTFELAHRFMQQLVLENDRALSPVTAWRDEVDRGYNFVKICTWDRAGLFGKIAGTLSAAGLNILSAQIFTRTDGIALDEFFVNDARTGNVATREQHEKFAVLLEKVLAGEDIDLRALIARQITNRPVYQAYAGERMETQIHFDNQASETRTLIEIETEDRLGLLYAISQTFAELAVDIVAARIVTERGAAIDSFYVRELRRRQNHFDRAAKID